MIFIDELRSGVSIILHPGKKSGRKMGVGDALRFYYKFSLMPAVLLIIAAVIFPHGFFAMFGNAMSLTYLASLGPLGAVVLAAVVAWVIEPIGMALGAAIFHLFGKILLRSFKNKFDATFTATMYATLPVILLYWLSPMPIVGAIALLISALWELLTLVLALSRQQGVSVLKSAGVILLSIIAVVAVAIIL